jgi:hypothetical protein
METPETLNISPKDFNIIKDYLVTEWNKGVLESIPCDCGKKKDKRYTKAFLIWWKGSDIASLRYFNYDDFRTKLHLDWDGYKISDIIYELIPDIVGDEFNITKVIVRAPHDCGCGNVPPRIINNPDPYIF